MLSTVQSDLANCSGQEENQKDFIHLSAFCDHGHSCVIFVEFKPILHFSVRSLSLVCKNVIYISQILWSRLQRCAVSVIRMKCAKTFFQYL